MTGGWEPWQAIRALPRGTMCIRTAVVPRAPLPGLPPGQERALGRAVALELIGHEPLGTVWQPCESRADKLQRRVLVAAALHQDVEAVVVLVDRAPHVMALAMDGQKDLVEVPRGPWLGTATLPLLGIVLPKLQTPWADGVMRDVDPAFQEEFLHVAGAQGEASIAPDAMADDLTGTAVIVERVGSAGGVMSGYLWRYESGS